MTEQRLRPLGRKIVAAILALTLLAMGLFFVLNIIPMMYGYRTNAADRARTLAELMGASLSASVDFEDDAAARENLAALSLIPEVTGAAVILGDGTVFASFGDAPKSEGATTTSVSMHFSALTVAAPVPAAHQGSVVVIGMSLDGQWSFMQGYFVNGCLISVVVFLFCFKVAGVVRRKLGDPLQELTRVVHDISRSRDYSRRVEHESDDEIGVLVAEFNSMLEQIEHRDRRLGRHREMLEQRVQERTLQLESKQLELMKNNNQLYREIRKRAQAEMIKDEVERINRHDLKSGLSLVIGYPELLLTEGGLTDRQELLIKRIRSAGYRMLDMIRNHLDMFKMEKGVYALRTGQIDLVEVLCELEEEFMPLLASRGVRLAMTVNGVEAVGDEIFFISGEGPLLRTLCRNLIQNAIEASTAGDVVTVSLADGERKTLTFVNPAPVPEPIRRRFFDKYVTAGKENGTGLGTYHAALIARTHGANISMKTDDATGTVMQVVFREKGTGQLSLSVRN